MFIKKFSFKIVMDGTPRNLLLRPSWMTAAGNRNRDVSLPAQAVEWDADVGQVVGFRPCEANFFATFFLR